MGVFNTIAALIALIVIMIFIIVFTAMLKSGPETIDDNTLKLAEESPVYAQALAGKLDSESGVNRAMSDATSGTYNDNPHNPTPEHTFAFTEGTNVICHDDGKVYLVQGGKLRWYPDTTIYKTYGSPPFTTVDCKDIANAPKDTPLGPHLEDGQVFGCEATKTLYKLRGGKVSKISTMNIKNLDDKLFEATRGKWIEAPCDWLSGFPNSGQLLLPGADGQL